MSREHDHGAEPRAASPKTIDVAGDDRLGLGAVNGQSHAGREIERYAKLDLLSLQDMQYPIGHTVQIALQDVAVIDLRRAQDVALGLKNLLEIRRREEERRQLMVNYRSGDVWSPHVEPGEPLQAMARHFAECVLEGRTPVSDGQLGLRVVRLLEAATRSIRAQIARIRATNEETVAGRIDFTVGPLTAEDDRVAAIVASRTEFGLQGPYSNLYHFLFQLAGGRIVKAWVYYDTALANRVLRGEGSPTPPLASHADE